MIVNNISKILAPYQATAKQTASKVSRIGESADISTVSDMAKDYSKIKAAISKTPDVREDKIKKIKEDLSAGTYFVDSGKIADKIFKA